MFAKISKKIVAVALVAAMAVTTATVASDNTASAAMKKKATVYQGKQITLNAGKSATWTSSNDQIAHCMKKSGKSIKIWGIKAGKATITATAGGKKQTCKVTVKKAKKGTVIYSLSRDASDKKYPGVECKYETFKYDSFSIFLFDGTFFGKDTYISPDYRGRKLSVSMKIKNTGKRVLPELGVCFNYTKGGKDGSYPFAYHLSTKKLPSKVKKDKQHKRTTYKIAKVKPGKSINVKFTFTIPKNAMNGDKDDNGVNYPIMMYIPNLKDTSPYKSGDAIKVMSCTVKTA